MQPGCSVVLLSETTEMLGGSKRGRASGAKLERAFQFQGEDTDLVATRTQILFIVIKQRRIKNYNPWTVL